MKDYKRSCLTKGMNWPAQGEQSVVMTMILDNTNAAKRTMPCRASVKDAKIRTGVWMCWTDGSPSGNGWVGATAVCTTRDQWRSRPSYLGTGVWGSSTLSCWWSDSLLMWRSRREKCCPGIEWRWLQSLATHEPQFDMWHLDSRTLGSNEWGGSINERRLSLATALQLRFTRFRFSVPSLETKRRTVRHTWPKTLADR